VTFQTGTITNLNDVLDVLATFLTSIGWTVDGNWREPIFVRNQIIATPSPPLPQEKWWRYGRRIHAHKGPLYISAQDFWYTYDFSYGTTNNFSLVGALQGPGISMTVSSGLNTVSPGVDADHPLSDYDGAGPAFPNFFTQPGVPDNGAGVTRTFIMPLPLITGQPLGRWRPVIGGGPNALMDPTSVLSNPGGDPDLPAPFVTPMTYWLMSDVAGDNVFMIVDRSNTDYSWIQTTPYLYFGDMSATKGGAWTGGLYAGASHGNTGVFELVLDEPFHCTRFAPPGAQRDGSVASILLADVDSWSGWLSLMGSNSGTARHFVSTTVLDPKPTDFNQNPLGIGDPSILPMTLRRRNSSVAPGPPCLPTYWVVKRDNGLWSLMGSLPDVYQARTVGVSLGSAAPAGADDLIYFDGYAIRRHV
jgi:hypothetical protein